VYTTSASAGGSSAAAGTAKPPPCQATATADISADCYHAAQGRVTISPAAGDRSPSGVDGNQIARIGAGEYLEYNNINFGQGSRQFDAQVASGAADGVTGLVEVVLDNPANPPIGSFAVGDTGGWASWQHAQANISPVTGVHNVYLDFVGCSAGNPPFVSLHYFDFPA
jgi:Carbohydrate binding module (family 6)